MQTFEIFQKIAKNNPNELRLLIRKAEKNGKKPSKDTNVIPHNDSFASPDKIMSRKLSD